MRKLITISVAAAATLAVMACDKIDPAELAAEEAVEKSTDKQELLVDWDFSKLDELADHSWRKHCTENHPDDYSLQDACRRQFLRGAEYVEKTVTENLEDSTLQTAIVTCLTRHSDQAAKAIDFPLASACVRVQVAAKERLSS